MAKPYAVVVLFVLAGLIMTGCSVFGGKAADEPAHRVAVQDGDFELREYASYVIAETTVAEPFEDAIEIGFGRLFDYISGANRNATKIEMTAPVLTEPEGEKIQMTAPVFVEPGDQSGASEDQALASSDRSWTISFVLPEAYMLETAPRPTDPQISLREVPEHRVASVRFSGRFRNEAAEENRQRLDEWLSDRGLEHRADWRFAGYNPPWTIPAFRRNEVLVTLAGQAAAAAE